MINDYRQPLEAMKDETKKQGTDSRENPTVFLDFQTRALQR